jgi:hypothetical protein
MTQEEIEAELTQLRTDMEELRTWATPVVESHAPNTPVSMKETGSDPNRNVMPAYKMLLVDVPATPETAA